MCGRYVLQRGPAALAAHFGTVGPLPNFAPSWNLAPTQDGLVVRRHPETGARHLDALRWGLVPHWARDASLGARLINARAESLAEKPAFRDAFRKRRCLVPADAFYEWRQEGAPGSPKRPYAVARADGAPMAFAGLWEGWRAPDGTVVRSYAIVTTAANAKLAALHARMPAILPPEAWPLWLGEEEAPTEAALRALLRPFPDAGLAVWPVSPRVNRAGQNGAGLLARDASASPPPGLDDPPPFA
ncbi:SOS response-associated peptidase [Caldovatus aquaticus]|uniref:Abasic site processing protein n=1 Tax=Caldovatus aquaticus TaxID=2865671 RepID=A0ABS7F255_9PROT|nr:SOS response-associated peptidase [Caldovatus aquaticus]MBW8268881.1 SOS response-associated peptidase [Caldovatus aquaticus]